ncbi:MAG: hypothetical protein QM527_09050 [Alphaproteobacteria bacterium]|jgi:hypothetical protein|uniref:hypothetical protein n=1 Tax=Rhodoferax potami TaxID=3068338 RepID=UPI0028BE56E6|nr:hypothetical protein [Rhodoferax sp. TBRC 17198]MDI9331439.1 hypothetical protein [Alphaproteobacteria bacterium]MDT7523476.1 hypothetical protein [Rhodoferax sp. TBRC 17198]
MSLDLSVRQGYAVEVVQVDESNLVMTVLVANPDGKASGRHIFNLKTLPGADLAKVCREAYPIAFEDLIP